MKRKMPHIALRSHLEAVGLRRGVVGALERHRRRAGLRVRRERRRRPAGAGGQGELGRERGAQREGQAERPLPALLLLLVLAAHRRVPVVLDRVVRSAHDAHTSLRFIRTRWREVLYFFASVGPHENSF